MDALALALSQLTEWYTPEALEYQRAARAWERADAEVRRYPPDSFAWEEAVEQRTLAGRHAVLLVLRRVVRLTA